jgi:hypothetical protein
MKKCLKEIQREKSGDEWQNKTISFSEIQHIFRENNIFDEKISIEHEGELYRLWCSDQSFIIYRVNPNPNIPPGIPGWTVCLVNKTKDCHECCASSTVTDHLKCRLKINDWMDKVRQYCRQNSEVNDK